MNYLLTRLKKWILLPIFGLPLLFFVIALNQSLQLLDRVGQIHPALAWILGGLLAVGCLIFFVWPVASVLLLPVQAALPKDRESPEFAAYLKDRHAALKRNRFLKHRAVDLPGQDLELEIANAYQHLDEASDRMIKNEATKVFLTTSVSQNGSLDALFMLGSLLRLVYRIVTLYEARPSLKRLFTIYTNVLGTVLVARSVEDMDLIEDQIEPLISSLLGGSVMTLVPGAVPITNLVVSSITEGAINALLALRCGCITQRYLASLTEPNRKALRRSASLEATAKLGSLLKEHSLSVVKSFGSAAKQAAARTVTAPFRRKNAME